jgi:hypothetical protein
MPPILCKLDMILQTIQQISLLVHTSHLKDPKLVVGHYSGFKGMHAGIISLQISNKSDSINALENPKLGFGNIFKCKLIDNVCWNLKRLCWPWIFLVS